MISTEWSTKIVDFMTHGLRVLVHGFIIHVMKMLNVFSIAEHRLGKVSKLLRKSSKDKSNM